MRFVNIAMLSVGVCLITFMAVHAGDLIVRDKDDEIVSSKPSKVVKMINFASQSAGAVILDKSPATAKGYQYLLNDDKDKYGISACEEKKWVVIGLSEDILITSVEVSNYEKYSSMLKDFQLLASNSYPTDVWINLGTYTAKPLLGSQTFNVTDLSESHTRYLKVKFLTHYSDEALCTLSQIKVYGMTVIASFQEEVRRSDHHTRDVLNHLSAEDDVNIRDILESSIREENLQESIALAADSVAAVVEPVAPVVDPFNHVNSPSECTDSHKDGPSTSCLPDIVEPDKGSGVVDSFPVVEKRTEGECASDLVSGNEAVASVSTTPASVSANASSDIAQEADAEDVIESGVISVNVSVDGGGEWVEQPVLPVPQVKSVDAVPHTPAQIGEKIEKNDNVGALLHPEVESAESTQVGQCTEEPSVPAPLESAVDASSPHHAPATLDTTEHASTEQDNTCTNIEGKSTEGGSEDGTIAEPPAAKPTPFEMVKKILEFNLFSASETTESSSGELHNATELTTDTIHNSTTVHVSAVTAHVQNNGSSVNNTHQSRANTTRADNSSSHSQVETHGVTNGTHVVSNVSVFVSNTTATSKPSHKTDPVALHVPSTVDPVHDKKIEKSDPANGNNTVHAGHPHDLHVNVTAGVVSDKVAHNGTELNTHTDVRPAGVNKTDNSTSHTAVSAKATNASSLHTHSNSSTSNGNSSALNCFENLSFAKFSEKMRQKLQKSGATNANGSGSDSAVVAEAAALAAAAGASAKDNNVFRSLMQKIKTLEVDNAIVEMYTIQLSDCYKTVTKELLSRTQVVPTTGEKKFKFSAEATPTVPAAHSVDDVHQLGRLALQILFNYTESEKLGTVYTFYYLLQQVIEENLLVIVLCSVLSICLLFVVVSLLICVILSSKRTRLAHFRDEH